MPNNVAHVKVSRYPIVIKGIALVKSIVNKSICNSFCDSKIHIPANTTKVTNVMKAATTSCEICFLRFALLSKVTPKFRAETAGVKFWFTFGVDKKHENIHLICI